MRTIDGQLVKGPSFWAQLWRDIRLLWRIAQMLYAYLVVGHRIRQAYRAKAARGEVFWVDEELT